ncbi:MAG: 3-isopropylmalate dehydratase small subunit [Bacillota bacterium]|jgi:3-isopropylmalate/(R)-2-methylmalate dehydratase small subunit
MIFQGKVHKYGDNVDTDAIIPARYLSTSEASELAKHCMEDIDLDFVKKVHKGDIIVAGKNFGCGSSREHAPLAIKAAGVSCVIAADFARIFFRNAINIGLPIAQSAAAAAAIQNGDNLSVDLAAGEITNVTQQETYQITPFPDFMRDLLEMGGLLAYTQKMIREEQDA